MTHNRAEPIQTETPNITAEQRARLKALFPEAFTEGKVDFEKLRATLGDLVDDGPERYRFTWAGKRDAIRMLQMPTRATLVPCREESLNFDETQHIFIEGDNLEVLKLLYKPYFGRVKMIYIDPPYNTGHDFIYPDNYADPLGVYLQLTGQQDAEGNLLTSNPETSGRYHSAWLSMMYPRLFLARQLLREDGVIFVSIDDHEVHNLRLLMNEVFGEENFIEQIVWKKRYQGAKEKYLVSIHEYILLYAKSKQSLPPIYVPSSPEYIEKYYTFTDEMSKVRGPFRTQPLEAGRSMDDRPNLVYAIPAPDGTGIWPKRQWIWSKERVSKALERSEIGFSKRDDGSWSVYIKQYLRDEEGNIRQTKAFSMIDDVFTQHGTKEMEHIFGNGNIFPFPKPTGLIENLLSIGLEPTEDSIVLDFFAGSAPTAHALLRTNHNQGSNWRFILVQLPEPTERDSEARKAGYDTIADIGKERIRRVIARMQQERKGQLPLETRETPEDLGFKVFKLAPSNYRPWRGVDEHTPEAYEQQMSLFTDPLVDSWTAEDVIYEVALKDRGYGLNCRIESLGTVRDPAQPGQPPPRNVVYRITDPDKEQSCILCLADKIPPPLVRLLELDTTDAFVCRDVALDDETAANLALQCRLKTI